MREDFVKFQEIMKKEYDLFSTHQSSITEKITEMIKIEIDTRLSSDIDLKNLMNSLSSDIIADINNLKVTEIIKYELSLTYLMF